MIVEWKSKTTTKKNCYTDILNNCRDFIQCLICWIM